MNTTHEWLRAHGFMPVRYGEGQAERIRAVAPGGVDAFIDTFGGGYVELSIELGVPPERINTIIDFAAVQRFGRDAYRELERRTRGKIVLVVGDE